LSERVRCPIALADGRLADVEISRCVGSGTVKITIPVRAAFVEPLTGEVTWSPVTLDEIFLPEDFFSEKIVGPRRSRSVVADSADAGSSPAATLFSEG
jgi:hypothetical protein